MRARAPIHRSDDARKRAVAPLCRYVGERTRGRPLNRRRRSVSRSRPVMSRFQVEYLQNAPNEHILRNCLVDVDGGKLQSRSVLAQDVREHPIAFEQIA